MNQLNESYLLYVDKPETNQTGECQKVDGRGWDDTKVDASNSAQLYVDSVSMTVTTPYHSCDS